MIDFKNGDFKIEDLVLTILYLEEQREVAECLSEVAPSPFADAMYWMLIKNGYSHENMLKHATKAAHSLPRFSNETDYLRELERVYNMYRKEAQWLRFF